MGKCDCWEECSVFIGHEHYDGICLGTKEREYCQCNGDASKCDFYPEKRNKCEYYKSYAVNGPMQVNECGRNDHTSCKCNGDKNKCDYNYFKENTGKENKTMKTLEMMNAAKENGKTYKLDGLNIFYNDRHGFIGADWNEVILQDFAKRLKFNKFFDFDWSERSSLMTIAEAEEKYGIKIIG